MILASSNIQLQKQPKPCRKNWKKQQIKFSEGLSSSFDFSEAQDNYTLLNKTTCNQW
jgi:hypothetical protein